jgi:ferredoxin
MTDLLPTAGRHGESTGATRGSCFGGCAESCPLAGMGRCSGASQAQEAPAAARRVTVTIEGHGSASVSTEERLLVALERARGLGQITGLPRKLPVGCRRGGCGVCRAQVIAGDYRRAPMSREHVSPSEEAEGVVLTCAIYAQSDLMLRLDARLPAKRSCDGND